MKAYERLNVEVVKFEAQDVITASVAECICGGDFYCEVNDGNHASCPAEEHVGCVLPPC